jgi:hypothetical protein
LPTRIIFTLPGFSQPAGGIWLLIRYASILADAGYDPVLHTSAGGLLRRFYGDVGLPVVYGIDPTPEDLVVRTEMNSHSAFLYSRERAHRQVLFVLNHNYIMTSLASYATYEELGVLAVAGMSNTIRDHLVSRGIAREVHHVPPAVARYRGEIPKRAPAVVAMPRKMPRSMTLIRDGFRARHPRHRELGFAVLDGASHRRTLEWFHRGTVFLSLQRLEGFGLPALEAMAAGCLVVGFAGGAEYATPENGYWAPDGDIDAAIEALAEAADVAAAGGPALAARLEAGYATAAPYGEERQRRAVLDFFEPFLDPVG